MASNKTPLPKASPKGQKIQTEADAQSITGRADKGASSSQNAKSNVKAGSIQGAGGGTKQERNH